MNGNSLASLCARGDYAGAWDLGQSAIHSFFRLVKSVAPYISWWWITNIVLTGSYWYVCETITHTLYTYTLSYRQYIYIYMCVCVCLMYNDPTTANPRSISFRVSVRQSFIFSAARFAFAVLTPWPELNKRAIFQVLSETPGAQQTAQKFPQRFSDYPRKPTYFDVYSPTIKTLQLSRMGLWVHVRGYQRLWL